MDFIYRVGMWLGMVIVFYAGLVVGSLAGNIASAQAADCQIQNIQRYMVKVHAGSEVFASGVRISATHVVTVLHALPQGKAFSITLQGQTLEAQLVDSHQAYDLALLRVDHLSLSSWPESYPRLLYRELHAQENVWAAGFDRTGVVINQGDFLRKKLSGIQTSAPIVGGFSGGPLLACHKQELMVAGLLRAYRAGYTNGKLQPRGISVATPAAALAQFLFLSEAEPQLASYP